MRTPGPMVRHSRPSPSLRCTSTALASSCSGTEKDSSKAPHPRRDPARAAQNAPLADGVESRRAQTFKDAIVGRENTYMYLDVNQNLHDDVFVPTSIVHVDTRGNWCAFLNSLEAVSG